VFIQPTAWPWSFRSDPTHWLTLAFGDGSGVGSPSRQTVGSGLYLAALPVRSDQPSTESSPHVKCVLVGALRDDLAVCNGGGFRLG
jgi:hypothetical protein